ncbi:hypothetical protein D3C76_1491920 [compost metagenome]
MQHHVWIQEFIAVLRQVQFMVTYQRVSENRAVGAGTQILLEAWQQRLGRLAATADDGITFKYQHPVTRFCQIGRADQAVVASTGNHIVEMLRRRLSTFYECLPGIGGIGGGHACKT